MNWSIKSYIDSISTTLFAFNLFHCRLAVCVLTPIRKWMDANKHSILIIAPRSLHSFWTTAIDTSTRHVLSCWFRNSFTFSNYVITAYTLSMHKNYARHKMCKFKICLNTNSTLYSSHALCSYHGLFRWIVFCKLNGIEWIMSSVHTFFHHHTESDSERESKEWEHSAMFFLSFNLMLR